jgi:oligopeptide/dipeptide ABC transporter ATP-binding protein
VNDVSLSVGPGETVGLVGESGSGKTTLARMVLGLEPITAGEITFLDRPVSGQPQRKLSWYRQAVQAVFQDPYSALNRRMRVEDIIAEPLLLTKTVGKRERRERVAQVMEQVGLSGNFARRFPHEFSGGQRQRIAIARALSVNPRLIVLDEPVSALDVSIRAQVLNLLKDLQETLGVSYLFIAHDLAVVQFMSNRIGVMYLGRIVELGSSEELYKHPAHPYTRALLSAIPPNHPRNAQRVTALEGEIPSPINPPSGCTFHPRCAFAQERCRVEAPILREIAPGQVAACHFTEEVLRS